MGKQRTICGPYSSDGDLGHDATGPLKVTEMDPRRTKNFTQADGVSFADLVDCNSNEESNYGLSASVKRRRR
jgi:hypothetical protein